MDAKEQREYLERYRQAKENGAPFFPEVLFKDAVVSLAVFLALAALAFFVGAPLEERADPADTGYTPRPEWYFLFLFQLLKYFPGRLEVIGVFVIPTLAVLFLFALPWLDRSPRRHFRARPVITGLAGLAVAGMALLTIQALREAPPPEESGRGDAVAALYAANCAGCHGPSLEVPPGIDLHRVIAQGKHEGMPAWSADLTSDQIDALAGFILSPAGSQLFADQCSACHAIDDLVAGDPLQLKSALEQGPAFTPHQGLEVPAWSETLEAGERSALLNFLIAPDGQRLFAVNCAPCHGRAVSFSGQEEELNALIRQGGLHLDMPPWRGKLSQADLTRLASYVVDPASAPEAQALFQQYCATCHGQRVPSAGDVAQASQIIARGGPHQTMPVWGEMLTPEQLDALTRYTLDAAEGTSLEVGQALFSQNCAGCHGDFGEGGPNPARPDDAIAPISSAEYLKTRDDFTLRAVIARGQPNFGMSPFGTAFGGPLDDDEIDAIVAYMRAWEARPPVELPPEAEVGAGEREGAEIYGQVCAQCHGEKGEGMLGPALADPGFQAGRSDQEIYQAIEQGHAATPMIAWGEMLTAGQIDQLVSHIRQLEALEAGEPPAQGAPSFREEVLPLFEEKCAACHGSQGGWAAGDYASVMTTGQHAPVVEPGDAEASLLAQKMLGTHAEGAIMPPGGKLPEEEIRLVLDWIEAGAPDN